MGRGKERLARDAVFALIKALVYVALIIKLFEYFFDGAFMIGVGGAYKAVICDIQTVPYRFQLSSHFIDPLLGRYAVLFCGLLDFKAVLVRAGKEMHVKAPFTLVACYHIGKHDIV